MSESLYTKLCYIDSHLLGKEPWETEMENIMGQYNVQYLKELYQQASEAEIEMLVELGYKYLQYEYFQYK